jgi:magnesium transporter
MRDAIMALEKRLDVDPAAVEMGEISARQSDLLAVDAMVSGQLPILEALIATERASGPGDNNRAYLACALTNLQAAERTLSWLEGRIAVIRSLASAQAQDQFNHRLGRLTILSSIFMPLTLLAGIWGMNFKRMPELELPYGYPIALAAMLCIGAGLYFVFRRRGWFD